MPKVKVCLIHNKANTGYGWVAVACMQSIFNVYSDREIVQYPCNICEERIIPNICPMCRNNNDCIYTSKNVRACYNYELDLTTDKSVEYLESIEGYHGAQTKGERQQRLTLPY